MGLVLPPQHRVDAEPIYVHPADQAWDTARIDADGDLDEHPVFRYASGDTRFDLHAPLEWRGSKVPASDWLDLGKAWQFKLRRLSARAFARIQERIESSKNPRPLEAYLDALQLGLVKIEGQGAPEVAPIHGQITEAALDRLVDQLGNELAYAVGQACFLASLPLSAAEKKA